MRTTEGECGQSIGAGRPADAEIDPAGRERFEHTKCFRDFER